MMGAYLGSMAGDALADALYAEDVAISRDGKMVKQPAGSFSVTGPGMNSFSIPQSQLQGASAGVNTGGEIDSKVIADAVYRAVIEGNKNSPPVRVEGKMDRRGMVRFVDDHMNERLATTGR
jgi:hypothetical protein